MSVLKRAQLEGAFYEALKVDLREYLSPHIEDAYREALEGAGGDVVRLSRGMMAASIRLAGENEALRRIAAKALAGEALADRPKPKRMGAGAPKGGNNPLPHSVKKYHAIRARDLMLNHRGLSAKQAAMLELMEHGWQPDESAEGRRLLANLQKRVSEAMRDL